MYNTFYQVVLKSYIHFEYVVIKFEEVCKDSDSISDKYYLCRDALIQRFEFSYDLTWKYLKLLLKEQYGIDVASPRKVFQECLRQKISDQETINELLAMIDVRNITTHTYDEHEIDQIAKKIPEYYDVLSGLMAKPEAHPTAK